MTVNGKPITANTTITIGGCVLIFSLLGAIWKAHAELDKRLALLERIGQSTGDDIKAIRGAVESSITTNGSRLIDIEKRLAVLESKAK